MSQETSDSFVLWMAHRFLPSSTEKSFLYFVSDAMNKHNLIRPLIVGVSHGRSWHSLVLIFVFWFIFKLLKTIKSDAEHVDKNIYIFKQQTIRIQLWL